MKKRLLILENDSIIEKSKHRFVYKRPTGRKIKVLGCIAYGEAFKNLPIGEIVDELDMSMTDPNTSRGVWIMGNGEPIKLINSSSIREFDIVNKKPTTEKLVENIFSLFNLDKSMISELEYNGLLYLVENKKENTMSISNFICELMNIPKRGNRQNIYLELNKR